MRYVYLAVFTACFFILPLSNYAQNRFDLVKARSLQNVNSSQITEGCSSGLFTLYRPAAITGDLTFQLRVAGVAVNGQDYISIPFNQVPLAAGLDSINLDIQPINDGIAEPVENIVLFVQLPGFADTAQLQIRDPLTVEIGPDRAVCGNQDLRLNALISYPVESIVWNPGQGLDNIFIANPTLKINTVRDLETKYVVTVRDLNNCVAKDSLIVRVKANPDLQISGPDSLCQGIAAQFRTSGSALPRAFYNWDFDFGANVLSGNNLGPYNVAWSQAGAKTISLRVNNDGCIRTFTKSLRVNATPLAIVEEVQDQCFVGHNVNLTYKGTPTVTRYQWNLGEDAISGNSELASPGDVRYSSPGRKTVSLVVEERGCSSGAQLSFELVPQPQANFTLDGEVFCQDACVLARYTGKSLGREQQFFWKYGSAASPETSRLPVTPCVIYNRSGEFPITLKVDYKGCIDSLTQNVEILALPVAIVDAGRDTSFCEGSGGVVLNSRAQGGGGTNYVYQWFANLADSTQWGISAGRSSSPKVNPLVSEDSNIVTYYVQAIGPNGCRSNVDSVRVTVLPQPRVNAGTDRFICELGPGTLIQGSVADNNQAPEPFSYTWLPAIGLNDPRLGSPLARPSVTTTYRLSATSINGCSTLFDAEDTTATMTVFVSPRPQVSVRADTAICEGDTIQLLGSASGGIQPYTFSWTPTGTGYIDDPKSAFPIVSPGFTTKYSFTATAQGCESPTAQVTVTVKARPTAVVSADQSACLGETAVLEGKASGVLQSDVYSYEWLPASGLNVANRAIVQAKPDSTTRYGFVATSSNGCASLPVFTTVRIKPSPNLILPADTLLLCVGDTLAILAQTEFLTSPASVNVNYEWSPVLGIIGSRFSSTVNVSPTRSTLYTVRASISGDCPDTASIFVRNVPVVTASLFADQSVFCQGDTAQLLALGGDTYTWSPARSILQLESGAALAIPDTSTTVQVIASSLGCSDTASLKLTVLPLPALELTSDQKGGCIALPVQFQAKTDSGAVLRWNFGDGSPVSALLNPVNVYDTAGAFRVKLLVTGLNGCAIQDSSLLISVSDSAFAKVGSDPVDPARLVFPLTAVQFLDSSFNAVKWAWDFGDGASSTEANPLHAYEKTGVYTVKVTITDRNGCVQVRELGPFTIEEATLSIPNVFTPNGDARNDPFLIEYTGTESVRIRIYDRWGKLYFETLNKDEPWLGTSQSENKAPDGVYFYQIEIGNRAYTGHVTLLR